MLKLSSEAEMRLSYLFPPEEREEVRRILIEECGTNLPFLGNIDETGIDRFRFAVLKLSDGDTHKLEEAINLAKLDWRDLLVAADFANDIHAHKAWFPERRWKPLSQ